MIQRTDINDQLNIKNIHYKKNYFQTVIKKIWKIINPIFENLSILATLESWNKHQFNSRLIKTLNKSQIFLNVGEAILN